MFIHSVKLFNYKSFGSINNQLILEKGITTIIGKNETGKSNVLEGLSNVSFLKYGSKGFSEDDKNRNQDSDSPIQYEVILKPKTYEKTNDKEIESKIVVNKESAKATGKIFNDFKISCSEDFVRLYFLLETKANENPFRLGREALIEFNKKKENLKPKGYLDLYKINAIINDLENKIVGKDLNNDDLERTFAYAKKNWMLLISKTPQIYFRKKDRELKKEYAYKEVADELNGPVNSEGTILSNLVILLGIKKEDFLTAVQAGRSSKQNSLREKIKRKIDEKINKEFLNFYKTERIKLNVIFNNSFIDFIVTSNDGTALSISERSSGLRWYLNLFIDAKSQRINNSNVLYLFDEPGISLHLDAQKTLLNLFEDLVEKGNQVVYTTHLPSMLNVSHGIREIRTVIKTPEGNTNIFKTAYDDRITGKGNQETLTPIIKAIGMSIEDTFGPAKNKLNIVLEGVSDYIYIVSIFKSLKLDIGKYNFISSVGATNSVNICNILDGWGCPFLAIFDFDSEGVERGANKLEKSSLYEYKLDFIYINDPSKESIESKEYKNKVDKVDIEDLIGKKQYEIFGINKIPHESGKPLIAKMFTSDLKESKFKLTNEVEKKFTNLYKEIEKIYELKL